MTDSPEKPALSPVKRALLAVEEMQAKLRAAEQRMREPLAIVGMGCRFPGGVSDPESCWELLRAGRDAVTEVPADRWDVDAYYDPDPATPGKMSTRWGGFLERVDEFDPEVFGISPREAQTMDPQQRLLLEVVWEALERAGQNPGNLAGTRTGVFVGVAGSDYAQILARNVDPARIDAYFASGVAHSIASGRLSYALGLIGPSLSIDTACSSSLVAVHQACQSLRSRESDMTIAGGVNLVLLPDHAITFSKSQMMAADGRCKAFDARADGFVRAEGCGVIVIKRLADALANDDPILAVIRGTAVNQDGASSGLTAPNGVSQQALLREALANAGLRPDEIGYVETHGTGTSLGDPIEVRALGAVFGPGRSAATPLYIGSVKTNFGHTEATAGVAGLIKAVLCLQQREIAPSLHFQSPNPHIAWEDLPIVVPTTVQPFPARGARRVAGVSSFGFSGTNAHVILEEAPVPAATASDAPREAELLVLSAKTEAALVELTKRYAEHVRAHSELTLGEVCHTARVGRNHFAYRLALFAKDRMELLDQLDRATAGQSSNAIVRGVVSGTARVKVAFRYPAAMDSAAREAAAARWRAWGVEPVDAASDLTLDIEADPTWRQTLLALARLYVSGVHLDWYAFDGDRHDRVVQLPTYPFQRQRYWVEQAAPASSDESILGTRLDSPAVSGALFTSRLGAGGAGAFALEHCVFGVPVLPATGYLAMAREAASQVLASPGVRLTRCVFHEALALPDTSPLDVQLIVRRAENGAQIEIFSRAADVSEWTLHVTVAASVDTQASDGSASLAATRRSQRVDREAFYTDLNRRGLEFGALFRGVETLAQAPGEAFGDVALPAALHSQARHYAIHPVLLDAALQVVGAAVVSGAPADAVFMPFEIESCRIASTSRSITKCRAHARILSSDATAEVLTADLDVYDTAGQPVATLSGIRFKRATRAALARLRERAVNRYLVELTWDDEDDRLTRVNLQSIAASVRTNVAANSVATGWEGWSEVEPRLDRVCRAYIARAFTDLGIRWNVGDRLESASLARQLGVQPAFVRLLGRFLAILARDGVVRRVGDGWSVVRAPSNVDVKAELGSLRRDHPEFQAEMAFTERCGPELAAALTGTSDPLQLLFPGGNSATAEHLYRDSPSAQLYNGIVRDSVAAIVGRWPAKRPLRVLEIGGGTAATTSHVIPVLSASGTQYTFTDLSPLFVAKAKERFASTGFFNARTLDIEQDPRKQGLAGEFDLIIAANVLHATRDLAETFAHVRQLLAPGGTLVCVEITRPQDWIDLSFGLTDGWWRFTDTQLRPEYPLLTASEWTGFLADNGFDDVAMVPEPGVASPALSLNAVMLTRRSAALDVPKRHLVLADRSAVSLATVERLRSAGHAVCVAFAGESYVHAERGAITLDPLSREQFERLLADAAGDLGGWPERVVHLWSLDELRRARPSRT